MSDQFDDTPVGDPTLPDEELLRVNLAATGSYQWATWLADALRADPVIAPRVVEHDGWQTWGRPPPQFTFTPRFVLSHHTACGTTSTPDQCVQQVFYVDHGDTPAPIAQLLITRDLNVHIGAAGRANHAGSGTWPDGTEGNGMAIGIEVCNNGVGEPWSDGLVDTYARVAAAIFDYVGYPYTDRLDTHAAYTARKPNNSNVKIDPAGPATWRPQGGTWGLDEWRAHVEPYLRQVEPGPPINPPTTPGGTDDMAQVVAKDGKFACWVTNQCVRVWIDGSKGGSTGRGGSVALAQQLFECGQADGSVFDMSNDEMMQFVKKVGQLEGYGIVVGPDPGDV